MDVDRNYENDDRAMAIQRALYDATSSLKPHENLVSFENDAVNLELDHLTRI